MTRPRILDLFCGQGGASAGYAAAGFDPVGVDLDAAALARYPFPAVRMDAMAALAGGVDLDAFDAIHASPPCQAYSITRPSHGRAHPDLLPSVAVALAAWGVRTGRPWVIENVPGAPMPGALTLCGSEFSLSAVDPARGATVYLRRHRLFLSNVHMWGAGGCTCGSLRGRIAGVYGGGPSQNVRAVHGRGGYTPAADVARDLMGMPWATRDGCAQAIPPAYARHMGEQLLEAIRDPALVS